MKLAGERQGLLSYHLTRDHSTVLRYLSVPLAQPSPRRIRRCSTLSHKESDREPPRTGARRSHMGNHEYISPVQYSKAKLSILRLTSIVEYWTLQTFAFPANYGTALEFQ